MNGEKKRARLDQRRAPIHEALENFRQMRVVPFDVPGHKRGRGNPELTAFLGQQCVGVDVNSMKPLDNLCHPVSVIRVRDGATGPTEMDDPLAPAGKSVELLAAGNLKTVLIDDQTTASIGPAKVDVADLRPGLDG